MPHPARPKLGQHFLRDRRFQRRIVESLAIQANDLVLEIGPGRGAMTELLAARAQQIIAIEVDRELARMLQQKFSNKPGIEVLEADILLSDLSTLCQRYQRERCFVFGNLPYYITSPILHHLLDYAESICGMGLVVQREVAERLSALPGSRDYGYLTVLTQLGTNPYIEFGVPPGAFSPPPKVDSALVTFQMKGIQLPAEQRKTLLEFVKLCFAHKRKNLLNNLAPAYPRRRVEAELLALKLPPTIRAEQLAVEQFEKLLARLR
ncbi:MAG: 16S rRNA (adenine(1518)-N(6)/adenine(1519)-N(6))-dimethyltransferase RsmA [Syntrophorhabdales bacterium]